MTTQNEEIYLVGGAVRDQLLGIAPTERDFVVVGSTPAKMLSLGFKPVGKDFPVFLHPETKEEYALARTEKKAGKGYAGFTFYTSPDVTLEEDLARRDLTINAIAQAADGSLIDPFDGYADIQQRILRHTSPAFVEDPVRVLRLARFAARFKYLGFQIAPETIQLALTMQRAGELDALVPERVWQETLTALQEPNPEEYFRVLRQCGALGVLFPEIEALFGIPSEIEPGHFMDSGTHTLICLQKAAEISNNIEVRFAVLCHALGKALMPPSTWPTLIGYDQHGKKPIDDICNRYKVSRSMRDLAILTSKYHLSMPDSENITDPKNLLIFLENTDAFRRPERFEQFLYAAEACRFQLSNIKPQVTWFMQLLQCAKNAVLTIFKEHTTPTSIKQATQEARLAAINAFLENISNKNNPHRNKVGQTRLYFDE